MISYSHSIVTLRLQRPFSKHFTSKGAVTLKLTLGVTQAHLN